MIVPKVNHGNSDFLFLLFIVLILFIKILIGVVFSLNWKDAKVAFLSSDYNLLVVLGVEHVFGRELRGGELVVLGNLIQDLNSLVFFLLLPLDHLKFWVLA